MIPVRHAGNAAALAPRARVEVIPSAGHFPHKDHPQRFVKVVHEFICGPQKPYRVVVEYEQAASESGVLGWIRILEF